MQNQYTPEPRPERARADIHAMFGVEKSKDLPKSPEVAVLIGCTFLRLGGMLLIESNGERRRGRPCSGNYAGQNGDLPQLPGAEPWERFHHPREWEGAIKLVDYFLTRLHSDDKAFVFDAFASVATTAGEA